MGISIEEFELKIDGVERKDVLRRYKDGDGNTYWDSFENGYYPLTKERDYIMDEDILKKVMKSFPDSKIFFRILTDYGESAYEVKDGKIKELTKKWE